MAVRAFAHQDLKWTDANKAGIRLQPVRADRDQGLCLGFLAFDAMATTGIHQHTGPAFSYFLHGALADHQGPARAALIGINPALSPLHSTAPPLTPPPPRP